MLSKSKAKFIRSLQLRKYRQKYHKITVEGVKIVNDLLTEQLADVDMLVATSEWLAQNAELIPDRTEEVEVTDGELKSISGLSAPNQVLAVVSTRDHELSPDTCKDQLCLYLDGIRDPGNLGTLFRTADWFGINDIFLSPDCVDPYNPKALQSSMSSVFRIKWKVLEDISTLAGSDIYAAVMDGKPMDQIGQRASGLLVLGNESRGVSQDMCNIATELITIPGNRKLGAESLNVAVAGGILMAGLTLGL